MNKIFNEKFCNNPIGWQLKSIRKMRQMTRKTLADYLNEKETTIQKYEDGLIGLTAAQIYHLSIIFSVPVSYFYCEQEASVISEHANPQKKSFATHKKVGAINATIGKNIKKRRLALGLSQADIAKHIGFTFQQIQKYEQSKNRVALSTAVYICDALNCSIYDLLE